MKDQIRTLTVGIAPSFLEDLKAEMPELFLEACGGFDSDGVQQEFHPLEYPHDALVTYASHDGITFVRRLREWWRGTIVVLTPLEDSIVPLLQAGADDCMMVPLHPEELAARVLACVRRYRLRAAEVAATMTHGKLVLNAASRDVFFNGVFVRLSEKEFGVLKVLGIAESGGVTKRKIHAHLYPECTDAASVSFKTIEVFVCRIRKKFMKAAGVNPIETVRVSGYRGYRLDMTTLERSDEDPSCELRSLVAQ